MARKYIIETFGCQMNYHDSERIAGLLEEDGYAPAEAAADADVVVINTCSVREKAEDKLYHRLDELDYHARQNGHRPLVAVAGCVAQQEGEKLAALGRPIDVIVGTQSVKLLPALLEKARTWHAAPSTGTEHPAPSTRHQARPLIDIDLHQDVSFPLGVARHGDPVRAWVTIIEGCNDYCSYCVVPYTRGHERMRPAGDILADVRHAADAGRVEIQLLGQIVNHYAAPDDPACDFPALLERVAAVPGVRRIRFASPHPRHTSERLITAVRDIPQVCKHVHLPVQSGSTRILTEMRRRHTREQYFDLVDRIRGAIPNVALSTDMIVGFPGETCADFDATMSLLEAVRFHSIYSFKYSVRPNTLASRRMADDVTEAEKTVRIMALQAAQRRIQGELLQSAVGTVEEVLVDSTSRRSGSDVAGRTSGNTVVNFAGGEELIGQLVPVRITDAAPNSLRGELA
ncbi:MAG: tRNA (N6-isopentenyl adenosine(37)-C2)-methylthiotransferase MiaB [Acidobacteriota bacterium]|nr:tRNA (N6-isopentenyl adenosine(37)-C2)-methylthiotransferase MiaB [Acidobacteriota bacterium]